jgi:hypothetical protein
MVKPAVGVQAGEGAAQRVLGESRDAQAGRAGALGQLVGKIDIHTGHTHTIHTQSRPEDCRSPLRAKVGHPLVAGRSPEARAEGNLQHR